MFISLASLPSLIVFWGTSCWMEFPDGMCSNYESNPKILFLALGTFTLRENDESYGNSTHKYSTSMSGIFKVKS